ncbi:MAG: acyltransferase family protein [Hyphomicrobiales bacterium]|nr:acyltransferase family protein [Hyphomicrobiales bacterium]
MKIYPTYWLIVVCLLLFDSATRHALVSQFHHFGVWISMWAVLSNLSIFGLDGLLFVGVAPDGPWLLHSLAEAASPPLHWLIVVSPAWSLSLELVFYILAPLIAKLRTIHLVGLFIASMVARILVYRLGYQDDPWSYRFFPFELAWFVAGMISHRLYRSKILLSKKFLLIPFLLILLFPLLPQSSVSGLNLTAMFLIMSTALALPALFSASRDSWFDRSLGELSYPIYLVHVPVIILLSGRVIDMNNKIAATIIIVLVSVAISFAIEMLFERRVKPFIMSRIKLKNQTE